MQRHHLLPRGCFSSQSVATAIKQKFSLPARMVFFFFLSSAIAFVSLQLVQRWVRSVLFPRITPADDIWQAGNWISCWPSGGLGVLSAQQSSTLIAAGCGSGARSADYFFFYFFPACWHFWWVHPALGAPDDSMARHRRDWQLTCRPSKVSLSSKA